MWCIPISSKIAKFEAIANKKIENQKNRGIKNPKCNTIRFSDIMGQKRAFLIQNMFPITKKYVAAPYIDRNTNNPVTIDRTTEKDILNNARDVLKLVQRGFKTLVFSDILQTRSDLIAELLQEKEIVIDKQIQHTPAAAAPGKISMEDRFAAAQAESKKRQSEKLPTKTTIPPHRSTNPLRPS